MYNEVMHLDLYLEFSNDMVFVSSELYTNNVNTSYYEALRGNSRYWTESELQSERMGSTKSALRMDIEEAVLFHNEGAVTEDVRLQQNVVATSRLNFLKKGKSCPTFKRQLKHAKDPYF